VGATGIPVERGVPPTGTPVEVGVGPTGIPVEVGVGPTGIPVEEGVTPDPTLIVPVIPIPKWNRQKKFMEPACVKGPTVCTQAGELQKGEDVPMLKFIPRAEPWVPEAAFAGLDADSTV